MDVERRIPHSVSFGLEEYVSIASSADGRRLVATVANPTSHLWTAPISDRIVDDSGVNRFALPDGAGGGAAIRARLPSLSLVQGRRGRALEVQGRRRRRALEGQRRRRHGAPAVSPDGTQIAFVVRRGEARGPVRDGRGRHGRPTPSRSRSMSRDAPSWSPDGKWIAVVATEGQAQPLFKVPVDGGAPVRLVDGVNYDPVWSPDGRFIVYSDNREGGGRYQARGGHAGRRSRFRFRDVSVAIRGQSLPLPAGRQGAWSSCRERRICAPELLAARPRDRAPAPADEPEARVR